MLPDTHTVNCEVSQSCLTLYNSMDYLPGSSIHEIFQARALKWVAISFSRGSSQPRNWTQVFFIAGRHFTLWTTREAPPHYIATFPYSFIYTCLQTMIKPLIFPAETLKILSLLLTHRHEFVSYFTKKIKAIIRKIKSISGIPSSFLFDPMLNFINTDSLFAFI